MKRKSGPLVSSDDKKARWEAGLDIDFSKDWEDLQVDIVKKNHQTSVMESDLHFVFVTERGGRLVALVIGIL
jgi:hypothetical protein